MNQHLLESIKTYGLHGIDFNEALAHCLAFGEVQCCASFFCMGYPLDAGIFFVQMLAGDFMECARLNSGRFDELHFARDFKGSPRIRKFKLQRLNRNGKRQNTTTPGK